MSLFRRRKQGGGDDNDLTLRPVRSAVEALGEANRLEERNARRRSAKAKRSKSKFFSKSSIKSDETAVVEPLPTLDETLAEPAPPAPAPAASNGPRRKIYMNQPLPPTDLDHNGDPTTRYVRNKVRTTKYTPLTFLPKNLYEQFSRFANVYFMLINILTVSPVFGGPNAVLSFIPIGVILASTAVKDAIEDLRRARSDEEVNVAASTKLGGSWRNVNQPRDPRTWSERLFGINKPGAVSKGVRKLRENEKHESFVPLTRPGQELEDALGPGRSAAMSVDTYASMPVPNQSSSPLILHDTRDTDRTSVRSDRSGAQWDRTLWKKLVVGDLVLLREDDQVPADMLVLATSDPDGLCFVETKNLDGETNLKPRRAVRATHQLSAEEDWSSFRGVLDTEAQHPNLYVQNGLFSYGAAGIEATSINEFLLRGCAIRNTAWVIGLVAFTGADTKIMMNGGDTPTKRSKIEKETTFNVVMSFVILIAICLFAAIVSGIALGRPQSSEHFFYEDEARETKSTTLSAILNFCACLIVFQNMVPIGLYISLEIVRTLQAYLISQDLDMWYEPLQTACVPKTWNISDDLGQIEYIFSDKTGTLTQNIMEFQRCSVNGVPYGEGVTEAERGAAKQRAEQGDERATDFDPEQLEASRQKMLDVMQSNWTNRYLRQDKLTFISPRLASELADPMHPQRPHLVAFFRALALCHAVLVDRVEKPDDENDTVQGHGDAPAVLEYKSESPDEVALVGAARDAGFPVVSRTTKALDIEVLGRAERHVPLRMLEFTSTRKRMSVVARAPDGRVILTCKGADSVIYERLARDHDPELRTATQRDMEAFANGGLRTLCVAQRVLSEEHFVTWAAKYDAAINSSAPQEERQRLIDEASNDVERDLTILGATALEDKLQEGVPEAIATLHKAGIKLWILTGDKVQTAIEIGYSCNLLRSDMEVMVLSATSADEAQRLIESSLEKILPGASAIDERRPKWRRSKSSLTTLSEATTREPTGKYAVVVDGDTLRFALEPSMQAMFLRLTTRCETVVCCRVSPAQKAAVVRMVKLGCNAMTLSIGDGANDVAMIQEANVGCGLFGLEGSQAAMSADYAFAQFRFLTKLLLVHGRWSYLRIADMHGNFFYKNIIWTIPMFWYLWSNGFDATNMYQYSLLLWYNLIFTAAPVVVLGATDQDVNARASLAFPELYKRGILGLDYTRTVFWMYTLDGLYQSVVVYFFPFVCWNNFIPLAANGRSLDSVTELGTIVAVAAVFAANTYVGLNTRYWSVLTWVSIIASDALTLGWVSGYSAALSVDFYQEMFFLFATVEFWGNVILTVILCLAPRFVTMFFKQVYTPLDRDIIREAWVMGDLKERLGIPRRRVRRRRGRSSAVHDSPPVHTASMSPADVPPAEHHEMRPLSFHVTAPSIGGQSDFSPTEPEMPPGLPTQKLARSATEMSYYSATDIHDA